MTKRYFLDIINSTTAALTTITHVQFRALQAQGRRLALAGVDEGFIADSGKAGFNPTWVISDPKGDIAGEMVRRGFLADANSPVGAAWREVKAGRIEPLLEVTDPDGRHDGLTVYRWRRLSLNSAGKVLLGIYAKEIIIPDDEGRIELSERPGSESAVEHVLTISAAHLPPEAHASLVEGIEPPGTILIFTGDYGWLLYAALDPGEREALHPDLEPIFALARAYDTPYVRFDADALVIDSLPQYEFESSPA